MSTRRGDTPDPKQPDGPEGPVGASGAGSGAGQSWTAAAPDTPGGVPPLVAAALRHGDLSRDHAETITRALDDLPDRVGPEVLARAEETLVAHARDCTPRQLRLVGRRILELVAPEVAEDEERRRLEDEERHAHEHTRLSLRDVGDGTTQVSGLIPTPAAQQLRALLAALHLPPPRPPRKPHRQ